jgi:hypothetical protein
MNEDASLALRSALLDIAPEGFNDMKIENFKRFKSVWPKEFPPIEPNTPMWWAKVITIASIMIKEEGPPPIPKQLPNLPDFLKERS